MTQVDRWLKGRVDAVKAKALDAQREAAQNAANLDYWRDIVPFFGGAEAAQRCFAQYFVDGDPFDLPPEWQTDTYSIISVFGNESMMQAMLMGRMVFSREDERRAKPR